MISKINYQILKKLKLKLIIKLKCKNRNVKLHFLQNDQPSLNFSSENILGKSKNEYKNTLSACSYQAFIFIPFKMLINKKYKSLQDLKLGYKQCSQNKNLSLKWDFKTTIKCLPTNKFHPYHKPSFPKLATTR